MRLDGSIFTLITTVAAISLEGSPVAACDDSDGLKGLGRRCSAQATTTVCTSATEERPPPCRRQCTIMERVMSWMKSLITRKLHKQNPEAPSYNSCRLCRRDGKRNHSAVVTTAGADDAWARKIMIMVGFASHAIETGCSVFFFMEYMEEDHYMNEMAFYCLHFGCCLRFGSW